MKDTSKKVSISELEQLRAQVLEQQQQNAKLKLALQTVKTRKKTKSFRVENCATANNFHCSFSQFFNVEQLKLDYKELIVSDNDDECVFKQELRKKLITRMRDALSKA